MTCPSACLVVVQGIQCQPMAICGEHAEGSEQLKQLLLHHGIGSVQGCGASQSHTLKQVEHSYKSVSVKSSSYLYSDALFRRLLGNSTWTLPSKEVALYCR